jgi:TPR repeat protein
MRFKGYNSGRNERHFACCVISRNHFLVSKNAAETLFQEGHRLYKEQRYRETVEIWGQAALLRHGLSHAWLSNILFDGRKEVKKDVKRASEFASAGAELGCAHSKGALAYCLIQYDDPLENVMNGLELAKQSAANDSSFGLFAHGMCYFAGMGVGKDDAEAVRLFKLAAQQEHASAQYFLGNCFYVGEGVAQDKAEAMRYWRLAAAQGHKKAASMLRHVFDIDI